MIYRSSHWRCSVRKGFLRNFVTFTWKYLCQSLYFNKVAGLRILRNCFEFFVNFAKFLRAPILQNTSGRLLLDILDLDLKNTRTTLLHSAWFYDTLDLGLQKCSDYLTGVRLILSYIGLGLTWKSLDYVTGLGLILL